MNLNELLQININMLKINNSKKHKQMIENLKGIFDF